MSISTATAGREEGRRSAPPMDVATTRRNRIEEIQALKNQRLVGENHAGYLEARNTPPGNSATTCARPWMTRTPTAAG